MNPQVGTPASRVHSESPTVSERPTVTSDEVHEGTVLSGKYRVVRKLGAGGMGSVWLARSLDLDVEVAVKVVRTEIASLRVDERLLQEARAAARLGHPAIVRVIDFGRTKLEEPFIVMERLTGEDLATAMMRRAKVKPVAAIRMLLPIAHALATAHGKGIVHRDLKPENIFLAHGTADGLVQPKLIDFGIAKLTQDGRSRITSEGMILGSPGYLAPDQARGLDCNERCDVWSLCVVLYELIGGELPFQGANALALLRAILDDEPKRIPECDDGLWSILTNGLEKLPERRPTMHELGTALARWLMAQGVNDDIAGGSLEATWLRGRASLHDALSTPPPGGAHDDAPGERAHRVVTTEGHAATVLAPASNADDRPETRAERAGGRRLFFALSAATLATVATAIVLLAMQLTNSSDPASEAASADERAAAPASGPATGSVTVTPSATTPSTTIATASSAAPALSAASANSAPATPALPLGSASSSRRLGTGASHSPARVAPSAAGARRPAFRPSGL